MAQQRESKLIDEPFSNILKAKGWNVENTHGNQYQSGFPDKYITHPKYSPRWVEYKVIENDGHVKYTEAQKDTFMLWASHNVPIFIIAARDLRGASNYALRERL